MTESWPLPQRDHKASKMSDITKEKMPPKTLAERQQKYRKSLLDKGLERITLVLESSAAQCLRDLSRDHNVSLALVFRLGMASLPAAVKAVSTRRLLQSWCSAWRMRGGTSKLRTACVGAERGATTAAQFSIMVTTSRSTACRWISRRSKSLNSSTRTRRRSLRLANPLRAWMAESCLPPRR